MWSSLRLRGGGVGDLTEEQRCACRCVDHRERERPIGSWRRTYPARESEIVGVLAEAGERWPDVLVGSYPSFHPGGPKVEVVVKSSDVNELEAASSWIRSALDEATAHRADRGLPRSREES